MFGMRYRILRYDVSEVYLKKHGGVPFDKCQTGNYKHALKYVSDFCESQSSGCVVIHDTETGARQYFPVLGD